MGGSDDASTSMPSPPSTSSSPSSRFSPATRDFLAGLGAGVASVVVGQPLDTLRVNEQAVSAAPSSSPRSCSAGPLATARRLLASSGPSAFWRGVSYPAATIGFQSAIVFQCYGAACRLLAERERGPPTSSSAAASAATTQPLSYSSVFLAGTVSGAAQLAVIVPVDLLKIRAQLSGERAALSAPPPSSRIRSAASSVAVAVSSAWRDGGRSVGGLYRGGLVTAARDVPSHGVYFAVYELCRELFDPGSRSRSLNKNHDDGGDNSPLALFAAGGVAGAASWLSVYPLDVLKTRVQAATLQTEGRTAKTPSASAALREAWAAGGLWRGLSSTLARAFVVNSVLFYAYESLMEAMGGRDPSDAPEEVSSFDGAVAVATAPSASSSLQ